MGWKNENSSFSSLWKVVCLWKKTLVLAPTSPYSEIMNEPATSEVKLHVRYSAPDGTAAVQELSDKPITIGRSPDADIITLDERASRMHCGIRLWDGEYYVKDLKSKNGTFLNNDRVEMAKIKPGDKVRLGNTVLVVEDVKTPGTNTSLSSVQDEMNGGKGYNTILREIVEDVDDRPPPTAAKPSPAAAPLEPKTKTAKLVALPSDTAGQEKKGPGPVQINTGRPKRPTAIKIKRK